MAAQSNIYAGVAGYVGRPEEKGAVGVFRRSAAGGEWQHVLKELETHAVFVHRGCTTTSSKNWQFRASPSAIPAPRVMRASLSGSKCCKPTSRNVTKQRRPTSSIVKVISATRSTCVVFDRQYSPFIFRYQGQTIVPAESVYAAFEAKQSVNAAQVQYAAAGRRRRLSPHQLADPACRRRLSGKGVDPHPRRAADLR